MEIANTKGIAKNLDISRRRKIERKSFRKIADSTDPNPGILIRLTLGWYVRLVNLIETGTGIQ